MTVDRVMFNSSMSFDGLETEQPPETIRDLYCLAALGVARMVVRLNGRGDLNAIRATPAANGTSGRVLEELAGDASIYSPSLSTNNLPLLRRASMMTSVTDWLTVRLTSSIPSMSSISLRSSYRLCVLRFIPDNKPPFASSSSSSP